MATGDHAKGARAGIIRRLLTPLLVFLAFLLVLLRETSLLQALGELPGGVAAGLRSGIRIGLFLSAASLLSRALQLLVWERLVARALGRPVPRLLTDLTTVVVYLAAGAAIVGVVFNRSLLGIWATSSVVGLVLGFALRTMILDIFTGVAVNLDRPYGLGDWIEVQGGGAAGLVGRIAEINWRATRLHTEDGDVVVVPNGLLGTLVVTNYSAPSAARRDTVELWLDFAVTPERATRILRAGALAATSQEGLLADPAPQVLAAEVGELGVRYSVRYWYSAWQPLSPSRARDRVTRSLLEHLARAGVTPAYPKEDVFHAPMPVRHLDSAAAADREALLERVEILAPLTAAERGRLAGQLQRHVVPEGTLLLREGEPGASLFILVEGLLHVLRGASAEGPGERVATVSPGQCVGEMSLLTGEPRSASLLAATEVVAYELQAGAFHELLAARPEIAEAVSALVAARRLANQGLGAPASEAPATAERESLARQILGRIRAFFRTAG